MYLRIAFITTSGHYEYLVMSCGLGNSPNGKLEKRYALARKPTSTAWKAAMLTMIPHGSSMVAFVN